MLADKGITSPLYVLYHAGPQLGVLPSAEQLKMLLEFQDLPPIQVQQQQLGPLGAPSQPKPIPLAESAATNPSTMVALGAGLSALSTAQNLQLLRSL